MGIHSNIDWRHQPTVFIARELLRVLRSKCFQLSVDLPDFEPLKHYFQACYDYDRNGNLSEETFEFSPSTDFMRSFDILLDKVMGNYLDCNLYAPLAPSGWDALSGMDFPYNDWIQSDDRLDYEATWEKIASFLGETLYLYGNTVFHLYPRFFYAWAMQRFRIMACLEVVIPFRYKSNGNHTDSERIFPAVRSTWSSIYGTVSTYGHFSISAKENGTTGVEWRQAGYMMIPHDSATTGTDSQAITAYLYGVPYHTSSSTYDPIYQNTHWVYGFDKLNYLKTLTLHRDNATSRIIEFDTQNWQAYYPQELLDAGCGGPGTYGTDKGRFSAYCDIMLIPPFETIGVLTDYPTYQEC